MPHGNLNPVHNYKPGANSFYTRCILFYTRCKFILHPVRFILHPVYSILCTHAKSEAPALKTIEYPIESRNAPWLSIKNIPGVK